MEERRRRRRVEGREEEKSAGEKRSKRKRRPRGGRRHDRVVGEDSKLTSAVKPDDPGRAETSFGFWASSSRALATWDAEWGGMAADCT